MISPQSVVMRDLKGASKWEARSFVFYDPQADLFEIPAGYIRQQTPKIEFPKGRLTLQFLAMIVIGLQLIGEVLELDQQ